jgi:AcrR family transcriptional regulator
LERSLTTKGQKARATILAAAEQLIAARGFYGTSMRDIAAAAKLPLATTIYHFAKKEQLYAAVLAEIAADLDQRVAIAMTTRSADALARALVAWAAEEPGRVKLLLRELLDNSARVTKAQRLPLGPFLEHAAALIAPRVSSPEAVVLHVVGAISYFIAAWPTIERIVGGKRAAQIETSYEREAIAFARRMFGLEEDAREASATTSVNRSRARSSRAAHD